MEVNFKMVKDTVIKIEIYETHDGVRFVYISDFELNKRVYLKPIKKFLSDNGVTHALYDSVIKIIKEQKKRVDEKITKMKRR